MSLVLALLGCGGKETDSGPAPIVEVGTGEYEFQTLEEGSELTMVHGPQGGWHMLAAAAVANMSMQVTLKYTIRTAAGVEVSDNLLEVQLWNPDADEDGTYTNMYGYLDVSPLEQGELDTPPELLAGETVILRIEASDDEGRGAADEVSVIAAPDPRDVEPDTDSP